MACCGLETICTPKAVGGLGLRGRLENNKFMSAKIWWQWVNYVEDPWAKLWHLKCVPQWPHNSLVRFDEDIPGSTIWKTAQENRDLVQKHSFWEVRNGQMARFSSESLKKEPTISCGEDTPLLRSFLHNNPMAKVAEFWDNNNLDQRVRRWKAKQWWQDKEPGEEIKNFIAELSKKRFSKSEDPDKLRWGYSPFGNFNPKEALGLLTP